MANISKLNVQGTAYNLRDADSLHYIGKINELPSTSTASITTDIVTGHTIAKYDYIVVGTDRLSYVCTAVTTSGEPATTTVTWTLISEAAAEIPVQDVTINDVSIVDNYVADIPIATDAAVGLVQAGTNLDINNGVISVATATDAVLGVVQAGDNIDINNGVISVAKATASTLGVVSVGDNIDVDSDGEISVAAATTSTLGVVSVGDNIDVTDGEISVPIATASDAAEPAFGVVKTGANITNTAGVISVADATTSVAGVVQLVSAINASGSASETDVPTEKAVALAIESLPEPMVFKGTVGSAEAGATIQTLPVDGTAKVGDTYKVITAGTYAGETAKVGDTFICRTKTASANTWVLIPSGDENDGTVMSVAASAADGSNLIVTVLDSETGQSTITEAGSIEVGIATGYALMSDAQAAKIATVGNQSAVYNSVEASRTAAATNSVAPAHVGNGSTTGDSDTLYIDFLNFGTDDVTEYVAPTP